MNFKWKHLTIYIQIPILQLKLEIPGHKLVLSYLGGFTVTWVNLKQKTIFWGSLEMEPSSSDREKSLTPLPFPSGFSISFLYCTPQRVSFQYVFLIVYLVLRVDGDVEHYLIHQYNSKYVLADTYEFGSLEDLVSCFRDELFYGKTKLRYPVTPQLVERFCLVREERIDKRN